MEEIGSYEVRRTTRNDPVHTMWATLHGVDPGSSRIDRNNQVRKLYTALSSYRRNFDRISHNVPPLVYLVSDPRLELSTLRPIGHLQDRNQDRSHHLPVPQLRVRGWERGR